MTVEQDPKIIGFLTAHGWGEASFFPMTSDASARRYARLLHSGRSAVLMDARDVARTQTEQFCKISYLLRAHGLSAPEIYARDFSSGFLLLEDFGDKVFSRLMDGDPKREDALYRNAIDMLVHLRTLVPPRSLTVASSDVLGPMIEPFFENYLVKDGKNKDRTVKLHFHLLEALRMIDGQTRVVALRDFHAENIMYLDNRVGPASVGLLDFQDAFICHAAYDLVSLLQDARRDVSPEIEGAMIDYYLSQVEEDGESFLSCYRILGVQRNLRILGIFARLALHQNKPSYASLIPRVRAYIERTATAREFDAWRDELFSLLSSPAQDLERDDHV